MSKNCRLVNNFIMKVLFINFLDLIYSVVINIDVLPSHLKRLSMMLEKIATVEQY